MANRYVAWGALLAALAVAAGAFGAHALQDSVTVERLGTFETAARYHLVHAVGLVLVALLMARGNAAGYRWAARLLVLGIVLFSGSLYLLVLLDLPMLGMVTPLGGVSFIAAWMIVAVTAMREQKG